MIEVKISQMNVEFEGRHHDHRTNHANETIEVKISRTNVEFEE